MIDTEKIRIERLKRRITQQQIATEAGCSISHYCHVERGAAVPRVDVLARICQVLNLEMSAIVTS